MYLSISNLSFFSFWKQIAWVLDDVSLHTLFRYLCVFPVQRKGPLMVDHTMYSEYLYVFSAQRRGRLMVDPAFLVRSLPMLVIRTWIPRGKIYVKVIFCTLKHRIYALMLHFATDLYFKLEWQKWWTRSLYCSTWVYYRKLTVAVFPSQIYKAKKNNMTFCVFTVTCWNKLGLVGRKYFFSNFSFYYCMNWCWMASRMHFIFWRVTFNSFFCQNNDPLDIKNSVGRQK